MALAWYLEEDFYGPYREDYQILENAFDEEGDRTCWGSKYSATISNRDRDIPQEEKGLTAQLTPDYVRWYNTGGEIRYIHIKKTNKFSN